jgi:tetratricopeptide (TPR) repeat protein
MGFAGELETATTVWNRALSAARRRGDLLTTLSTLTWRGFCALRRGELRDAESDVREGLELGDRTAFPPATAYTAAFLAEILTERGEFSEAESVLGDRGLGERVPENVHFSFLLAARGKLHLVRRRPQQALTDFTEAGEIARRLDVDNPAYSAWRSDSATALLALGRAGHARRLAEEELDLARRWNEPRAIGIALRTVGLACGGPEQENWLREAVDVLSMSSARLEHAKALVELGAALRRATKRSEARELLRLGVGMALRSAASRGSPPTR